MYMFVIKGICWWVHWVFRAGPSAIFTSKPFCAFDTVNIASGAKLRVAGAQLIFGGREYFYIMFMYVCTIFGVFHRQMKCVH